jgi:ubiquinone/menaquinone biosynthesis C-methylase UbiE
MLQEAVKRVGAERLCQGRAGELPIAAGTLDLVYCVNALHHFAAPESLVHEARRLLRSGGALAVIGFDPRAHRHRWYVYDYFPGTCEQDLARFPSWGKLVDWMGEAGFRRVERQTVELIVDPKEGRAILEDPFFQKHGTSQLILLSDKAYAAGRRRVERAVAKAEEAGERVIFPATIETEMVTGWVI